MKVEFNKDIKILKKNQTEIMLEMKFSTSQTEFSVQSLLHRMVHAEDRTIKFEEGVEEVDHLIQANDKFKKRKYEQNMQEFQETVKYLNPSVIGIKEGE